VSAKPIPETANRQDWPRLVANKSREQDGRLNALENGAGGISRAKGRFVYG